VDGTPAESHMDKRSKMGNKSASADTTPAYAEMSDWYSATLRHGRQLLPTGR
jgi:hypothetical protein